MVDASNGSWGQLKGLKVVEFAHVVAGPMAGSMLADQGADVVHVEPPGEGDAARAMGPTRHGVPLWFKVAGRNKRSVTLDLRQERGREVAARLVAWADVVIVTLRANRLRRWGLDWESVHAINPTAILLQISGFGATSTLADAPGFGKMGEARSGVVALVDHDLLGIGSAVRAHRDDEANDRISDSEAAIGVLANPVHDAGDVHTGDIGRRPVGELRGTAARTERGIGRVHRDGVDPDPHLTGAGLG
jgi:hypothetical protein